MTEDKVNMRIFDCHTHLTGPIDLVVREMDRWNVEKAIVCPSGVARGEEVVSLQSARRMMDSIARSREAAAEEGRLFQEVLAWNRKTAQDVALFPGRLLGFAKIDLRLSEREIDSVIEEAVALGLAGFGEILGIEAWPDVFGYAAAAAGRAAAASAAGDIQGETQGESGERGKTQGDIQGKTQGTRGVPGFPLFVHGDFPITPDTIQTIGSLAAEAPDTPIILGHLGGDFWINAIETAAGGENIYLDISEAVNSAALRAAAEAVPHKLLFGSDFPWETMGVNLERVKQLDITRQQREAILGNTIAGILDGSWKMTDGARNSGTNRVDP